MNDPAYTIPREPESTKRCNPVYTQWLSVDLQFPGKLPHAEMMHARSGRDHFDREKSAF
jgi:hypothetical protein